MKLKKMVSSVLCLLLLLGVIPVKDVHAEVIKSTKVESVNNQFDMVPLSRLTFQGNSGSCRVDYMTGAHAIAWGVNLYVGVAEFSGTITIAGTSSSNQYYRTYNVYGSSGVEELSYSMPKGSYTATLNGVAVGLDGNRYGTVSNSVITFYF